MTASQHNRFLGIAHLAYASLEIAAVIGVIVLMFVAAAQGSEDEPPIAIVFGVLAVFALFMTVLSCPSIIAGYALLKRRPWAKNSAIVAGAVTSLNFPLGMALTVYTFWFLFSAVGRQLYDGYVEPGPPLPPDFSLVRE